MSIRLTAEKLRKYTKVAPAVAAFFTASQAHAADIIWADSAGNTTWTSSSTINAAPASVSWVGGVAPQNNTSTDNAIFTSVTNAQPVLTVQTRITGVDFRMAAGGLAMEGNNNLFQTGAGGIDSSLQTSGTNTITNTRILTAGAANTWNLFSSVSTASTSTFTFDSVVELGQNLTVIGQRNAAVGNVGIINFERAITGVGTLTINSSNTNNTVNLKGANTYAGVTNVNGGIVNVSGVQTGAAGGWNIQTTDTAGKAATVNFATGSVIAVAEIGGAKIQIGSTANSGSHPASTLNVAGTVTNNGNLELNRASNLNLNDGARWTQGDATKTMALAARGGGGATVNVNAGAEMTYTGTGTVKLTTGTSGSALLNINGTGRFTTAAGFENLTAATTGSGVSRITLTDGGTLRLSANVANLTTQTQLALAGTGGVINNNGFNATLSGANTLGSTNLATGITGVGGLTSTGGGTLTLSGDNTFTGGLTVTGGTVAISASERIANANKLTLNGGNFNVGTFTETLGALAVGGSNGELTLGTGGLLVFGASSAETWTGSLTISGTFISGSSLRFGTNASGLTSGQLSAISIPGFTDIGLGGSGFLTATVIPEPSSFAALAGLCGLALVSLRRRSRA